MGTPFCKNPSPSFPGTPGQGVSFFVSISHFQITVTQEYTWPRTKNTLKSTPVLSHRMTGHPRDNAAITLQSYREAVQGLKIVPTARNRTRFLEISAILRDISCFRIEIFSSARNRKWWKPEQLGISSTTKDNVRKLGISSRK